MGSLGNLQQDGSLRNGPHMNTCLLQVPEGLGKVLSSIGNAVEVSQPISCPVPDV